MRYIIHPGESSAVDRLGGKAAALAALHRSGASIPAWFVLTAEAFDASLGARERHTMAASPAPDLQTDLTLGPEPRRELSAALARLCPNAEPVAVRSSAADEDGAQHSFAGQFESYLFVPPAAGARDGGGGLAFRLQRTSPGVPPHARLAAGQPPTRGLDPADGQRESIRRGLQRGSRHRAAWRGGGRGLVRPRHAPRVGRAGGRHAIEWIATGTSSNRRHRREAVRPPPRPRMRRRPPVAWRCPARGRPPAGPHRRRGPRGRGAGAAAPDTTSAAPRTSSGPSRTAASTCCRRAPSPPSRKSLTRTVPSACGTTATSSRATRGHHGADLLFARRAYEEVYRQFCRLMRVPAGRIAAHDDTFRCMLGLIRGRVYYNLLSWYRDAGPPAGLHAEPGVHGTDDGRPRAAP